MLPDDLFAAAPFEFKTGNDALGEFTGYGAFFGNLDKGADRILPGAFADTIKARAGRPLPMHLEHGIRQLGGRHNVGLWKTLTEDSKGLEVKGRIAGMNTETGRYLFEAVKEGVYPGLSIGFRTAAGGVSRSNGERTLSKLHLNETSLSADPLNEHALITEIKSGGLKATSAPMAAASSIAAAIALHQAVLRGNDSPTAAERNALLQHLQDAHQALTGQPMPVQNKTDLDRVYEELGEVKTLIAALTGNTVKEALITADLLGFV